MNEKQLVNLLKSIEAVVFSHGGDGDGSVVSGEYRALAEFYKAMPGRAKWERIEEKSRSVLFITRQEFILFTDHYLGGADCSICVRHPVIDNGVLPDA